MMMSAMALDAQKVFITSWKTDNPGTSTSTQITVPTVSSGTYDCTVYWGDGNTSKITTYNDAAWTHTYSGAGTYTVKIFGIFKGLRFNNGGDRRKILTVDQWGSYFRLGTNQGTYFGSCSNLVINATNPLCLLGTTSLSTTFRSCTSITSVPGMPSWNMSQVTSLASMFLSASSFNQNVNSWDVHAVTLMNGLFSGTLFNQPLNTWNTSSVTSVATMFLNAPFNQDISSWDVSHVTLMNGVFQGTPFNQNISGWNTSAATNMSGMFLSNTSFNQNIGSWSTANVTDMSAMFNGATAFNQDISSWNTAKVTTMANMFQNVAGFNQNISGWNTVKVVNFASMFSGATSFDQNLGGWNITALIQASSMFSGVTLSKTNYNALLAGWGNFVTPHNTVTFSGGNSHYDATTGGYNGTAGRLLLTGTYSWSITDAGTP